MPGLGGVRPLSCCCGVILKRASKQTKIGVQSKFNVAVKEADSSFGVEILA